MDQSDPSHALANGIVDTKTQTILTTASGAKTHFSPLGPIHLTAEECNEILMKRALAATQQTHTLTSGNEGNHSAAPSKNATFALELLIFTI